jgi:drug/metabolite transporter (DMT)-like permease
MRIVGDNLPRDSRTWRMLFIQAYFNSILSWSTLAWGQQHIDVALASVLNSTSPIFGFFITLALVRKAPPGRSLWGACVCLCGVALIVGGD